MFIHDRFHIDKIHNNLQVFPDLAADPIYQYTYIDNHLFNALQRKITHSIDIRNAFHRDQYILQLYYSIVDTHPHLL